jgi:hypothetical protein
MSLRSPEDERPRARLPPGTGAAPLQPQVVAVADRMGALLLHPQTAALLHVDHSHRVAEPTAGLHEDEKNRMDELWEEELKQHPEWNGEGRRDWRKTRAEKPGRDEKIRELKGQIKLETSVREGSRGNKAARAEQIAKARQAPAPSSLAGLLGLVAGGGAAASSGPPARARAAAAGPGPVEVKKPFYRTAYYLQWDRGNDDQNERLRDRQRHRVYKLERHMLLKEDPMIIPYDETWWEPRDDAPDGSITMCDDKQCYENVKAIDLAPYFKYETYASSAGVSLTLPETASTEPPPNYYVKHTEQPGNSKKTGYDDTKTYIEWFMENLDKPESKEWYPDARAIYVDVKLFDADEEPLSLYLRQTIFERNKDSQYDRVYICGRKEIDYYMQQLEGEEYDAAHRGQQDEHRTTFH